MYVAETAQNYEWPINISMTALHVMPTKCKSIHLKFVVNLDNDMISAAIEHPLSIITHSRAPDIFKPTCRTTI